MVLFRSSGCRAEVGAIGQTSGSLNGIWPTVNKNASASEAITARLLEEL